MTPDQIKLVRDSFTKVRPIQAEAAAIFYGRLFEVAPSVRGLFKSDLKAQGAKLMASIALVVVGLDKLDEILPQVEDLARRHVAYGARDEHYAVVGETLIWTLKQGLGEAFTAETEAAWVSAYGVLSNAMIAAAHAGAA